MNLPSPPGALRVALALTRVEVRRLFRDRVAVFFVFALPALIILLVGSIFGGRDDVTVGLLRSPGGTNTDAFVARLTDTVEVHDFDDRNEMIGALRHDEIVAAIVVPDIDAALTAGNPVAVEVLSVPGTDASGIAALVRSAAAAEGVILFAGRFAADTVGAPLDDAVSAARHAAGETAVEGDGVVLRVIGAEDDQVIPDGFGYPAASNLVLFTFITSLAASGSLIRMRRMGIARRALAAPVRSSTILIGLTATRLVNALIQSGVILVVGTLLGVDWGDPLGAALIVVAFALVGAGAGLLAATFFRTEDQAGSIGPPIGIALGMLGGCMWPLEIVPPAMRAVGHALPHAWAMDGFIDILGRGLGVSAIVPELAVLLGFAAVLLTVATIRTRAALLD